MSLTAELKRSISILIQQTTYLIIAIASAFFTSINIITNYFAYNDWWMFVKNPFMQSGKNLALVFFTNPWTPVDGPVLIFYHFRPLIAAFRIVECYFFGTKAGAYHLVNVIIYMLLTSLVFKIDRNMKCISGLSRKADTENMLRNGWKLSALPENEKGGKLFLSCSAN